MLFARSRFDTSRISFLITVLVFVTGLCTFGLQTASQAQDVSIQSIHDQAQVALHGTDRVGKDGAFSRLGSALSMLYHEHNAFVKSGEAGIFTSRVVGVATPGDLVTIDATARGNAAALESALWEAGAERVTRYKHLISARIPLESIPDIASLQTLRAATLAVPITSRRVMGDAEVERRVRAIREAQNSAMMAGSVTSRGDSAMNSDDVRASFAIDGAGVKVGSLSDSYDTNADASTSATDDIASGDLPPARRLDIIDDGIIGSDEGRAMMQLIHDVAPGADQAFHTAFGGQADFALGILELADAGSDVIVDDVGYLMEPFFQDGVIAQAVDDVAIRGIPYFSSAGNAATNSYETDAMNFVVRSDGTTEAFDFDTSASVDTTQSFTLSVGSRARIGLQWDDPSFSASSDPAFAADTDVDIFALDTAGNVVTSSEIDNVASGDPAEFLDFFNDGSIDADNDGNPDTQFQLVIVRFEGPQPGRIKYIQGGSATVTEYRTESSTSYGHSVAEEGAGVAAAAWFNSPEFGADPAVPEEFTSLGGAAILFFQDGSRKPSPEVRNQPRFTAPDGTNTTFFGQELNDGDSFPNFFGTSAAAPHAAAVAALQLQADPSLTTSQVYQDLAAGARDMFASGNPNLNPGYDFLSGAGFIDASQTITSVTSEPRASLSPETIDFGTRFIDTGNGTLYNPATATVRLRNTGTDALDITSVSTSGSAFQFQSGSEITTGTVAVGNSVTGIIEFAGSTVGTFSETLTIESNAANATTLTVPIDLIVEEPPVVNVPTTQLFEAAEIGTTESEQITVENTGATDLEYDIFAQASGIGPFSPDEVAFPSTATSQEKTQKPSSRLFPIALGLSPKSNPTLDPSAFLYTLDDGTVESSRGFADGVDTFWLNAFQAQEGATTITAIGTAFFNQLPVGSDVHFLLYEDPNDDGDPTDAVLLEDVQTLSEVSGGNQIQVEPIPPTQVENVFFVAVLVSQGPAFPTPLDTSSPSQGASWISSADAGTFDVTNLSGSATQNAISPIPENWVLRAQGSYVAFEPVSGRIASGNSVTVDITFDGTSLPLGTYDGNAAVSSNDPVTPQVDIPFDFFVATGVGEVADISTDETYSFGNAGVTADLTSVTGSGRVTAAFFNQPTPDSSGIDPALNISPYRWIIVDEGNVGFDASSSLAFARDVIPMPGFDATNGPSIDVHSRSPFETGSFSVLTSSYADGGTTTLDDDAVQATGLSGFSEFVFASDQAALPVELAAFDVAGGQDGAVLTWETVSETNNAGFRIEYQEESATAWTDAGVFVEGAGTTMQSTSYRKTISGLEPNTYTFRMRQIDVDGTETPGTGKSVTIRMSEAFTLSKVTPNPVGHTGSMTLSVREAQPVTVSLYNVLGQKVTTLMREAMSGPSTKTVSVDASRLSSGIYFVRVVGERFQATQKITVVR